jgi:CDP-diacylglycerol--serine O-phosphatidyltransferase
MISPWRYYAFKDNAFLRPRSPLTIVLIGALIIMIFLWRQPVLLLMASTYTASGVLLRIGGIIRRRSRRAHNPPPALEQSVG